MIPSKSSEITQTGSLPGKRTLMTIEAEHMPHILNLLTNLYSDIILAILREYSANAWDSHVAAGVKRPIEVTTPSKFHPYLEIQDYGLGMSIDFIENEFSKYGSSTKRETNGQVGAFGIGGKSALAYSDTFTLTTVKDGVKGVFVVARDENGAAGITTVDTRVTDEPNGVRITIPAKNTDDFDSKVEWFFKFWEPGTVLVNGVEPRRIEAEKLTDSIYFVGNGGNSVGNGGNSYVVMGNIPYRVANASNYLPAPFKNFSFIIYVPIGSVSITPSREALEYGDDGTRETLLRVTKEFSDKMWDKVEDEILSEPDHYSAWAQWNKWYTRLGASNPRLNELKYKGDKFESRISVSGYSWNRRGYGRTIARHTKSTYSYRQVGMDSLKMVVVKDKNAPAPWTAQPSSYQRQKTKWFCQENGLSAGTIYFLDEVPDSPWVQGMTVYTLDEIMKTKNPNTTQGPRAQRPKGKVKRLVFFEHMDYWEDINLEDLEEVEGVVLVTPEYFKSVNTVKLRHSLIASGLKPIIIRLGATRWPKFQREHEGTESLSDYLNRQVKVMSAALPKESWEVQSMSGVTMEACRKLDPSLVSDPEAQRIIRLVQKDLVKFKNEYLKLVNLAGAAPGGVALEQKTTEDYVLENYPLVEILGNYYSKTCPDFYYYMNKKYEDKK